MDIAKNQETQKSCKDASLCAEKMLESEQGRTTITFTLEKKEGILATVLHILDTHKVALHHIESRPSRNDENSFEVLIICGNSSSGLTQTITDLRGIAQHLTVVADKPTPSKEGIPWFPRRIKDLDVFANKILSYGSELDADHPGFTDPVYRARRKELADIAFHFKHGQIIPRVEYTAEEIKTWSTILSTLSSLFPTHACRQYNEVFSVLMKNCGYQEGNIPQLQDISDFLKERTGFQIRPVSGLLTSRDFLAGLAFRVFHSTQYVRHNSQPMFTPEPDVCHELLGHVPMFADPAFAQFSQEIGLASLGAPDDDVEKLATLYWFTVEFGLCRQEGQLRAYGAAILSSFEELQYCLSDKPEVRALEPEKTCLQKYPISQLQPVYFAADSFEDAQVELKQFAATIPRPFSVRYNPYTQSIEVINSKDQVTNLTKEIKGDLSFLEDVLSRMRD